jgi:hypothetical protein
MQTPSDDDTRPMPWLGRAAARPRDLADTAEQPIVPSAAELPPVPDRWPARRLRIVGVMVACFVAGALLALLAIPGLRGAVGIGPSPAGSSAPSPPASPTPPPPPGIGDSVRDTTIAFRVTAVTCGHGTVGQGLLTRRAKGQYCVATFEVDNVGGTLAILNVTEQVAVTTTGSRHAGNPEATAAANNLLFVLPLPVAKGASETGKIVFEIPQDAVLATLELHDGQHSDGAVISVGSNR